MMEPIIRRVNVVPITGSPVEQTEVMKAGFARGSDG
jgi:hypothetical protein